MTKQQKTYLLLGAVLLIWGLISYQVFRKMNPVETVNPQVIVQQFKPEKVVVATPYTIKADYRDPFLGKLFTEKKKIVKKRVVQPKEIIPFPDITYNGVVEQGSSKSYIVTVNGQQEIIKRGQTFHKIKLLNANASQIKVRFNGTTKIIKL